MATASNHWRRPVDTRLQTATAATNATPIVRNHGRKTSATTAIPIVTDEKNVCFQSLNMRRLSVCLPRATNTNNTHSANEKVCLADFHRGYLHIPGTAHEPTSLILS